MPVGDSDELMQWLIEVADYCGARQKAITFHSHQNHAVFAKPRTIAHTGWAKK